jgi:ribosomal protein S18 acetylase RimI-like enzyme
VHIRTDLRPSDHGAIEELLQATGYFNPKEIDVALELVDDRLTNGDRSYYRFLVLEDEGVVRGYVCWGPIRGTVASADLYWIAVHPTVQGQGLGRTLLEAAEVWMAREGRTRVYVETATRELYAPTSAFYERCGYEVAAELPDFYAPGDGKAIYLKLLPLIH